MALRFSLVILTEEIPGENIILPEHPSMIKYRDYDLNKARAFYIKNCITNNKVTEVTKDDIDFLVKDTKVK